MSHILCVLLVEMENESQQFIAVGLLMLVAVGMAIGMLVLPTILGKKRIHSPVKDSPYECGMPSETAAEQLGSILRAPSTSTMHMRQAAVAGSRGS